MGDNRPAVISMYFVVGNKYFDISGNGQDRTMGKIMPESAYTLDNRKEIEHRRYSSPEQVRINGHC